MKITEGQTMMVEGIEVMFLFDQYDKVKGYKVYEVILDEEDVHICWVDDNMTEEEIVECIADELREMEMIAEVEEAERMVGIIETYKDGELVSTIRTFINQPIIQNYYEEFGKENVKVYLEMDALEEMKEEYHLTFKEAMQEAIKGRKISCEDTPNCEYYFDNYGALQCSAILQSISNMELKGKWKVVE